MTCIATLLFVMAGSTCAGTEPVEETLESLGAGDCEAETIPNESKEVSGVRFKADWTFDENSGGLEDRWTFTLDVKWIAWPTDEDLLGEPIGSSPGDDHDEDPIEDMPNNDQEGIQGELLTRWWHDGDFELEGNYKARIHIEVLHETKDWNEPADEWEISCEDSDDMVFTIEYSEDFEENIHEVT